MEHRHEGRRILARLDRGNEVIASLTELCRDHEIGCANISGIGAVRDVELGYFDLQSLSYRTRSVREVCELVSLSGNVALVDGYPMVHAHVALGRGDFTLVGGHLMQATVAVTVEVFIETWESRVERKLDSEVRLNLIADLGER